jgi:hypothetical protein
LRSRISVLDLEPQLTARGSMLLNRFGWVTWLDSARLLPSWITTRQIHPRCSLRPLGNRGLQRRRRDQYARQLNNLQAPSTTPICKPGATTRLLLLRDIATTRTRARRLIQFGFAIFVLVRSRLGHWIRPTSTQRDRGRVLQECLSQVRQLAGRVLVVRYEVTQLGKKLRTAHCQQRTCD